MKPINTNLPFKVKISCIAETVWSDRKNNDIFDPRGTILGMVGWHFTKQKKRWPTFPKKWSLGTQESFWKVSDQLDSRLSNYGLISRHTSSINCVNNCTLIFTRHQPRLFLKALLVLDGFEPPALIQTRPLFTPRPGPGPRHLFGHIRYIYIYHISTTKAALYM